jgi:hypothetical protein
MTSLADALAELRAVRRETVRALAGLDDSELAKPVPWRGAQHEARFRMLRLADDDLLRTVRLETDLAGAGHRPTAAHRILGAARRLRGRLMGSLVGLTEAQFDQEPEEEWSVRRVLGHLIANDHRYVIQTLHSVERARTGGRGSMRPPDSALPDRLGVAESTGTVDELLARMQATHYEVIDALAGLTDTDLDAPTNWMMWNLDVRFRLHRFAEHDREHLVQLRKTYAAIGFVPTEAQRTLEEAGAARGELEALAVGMSDDTPATEIVIGALSQAARDEREAVAAIVQATGPR